MAKKAAKKVTDPGLPDVVYIVREVDGDESYLVAWDDYTGIDSDTIVGTYERVSTSRVQVSTILEAI